MPKKSRSTKGRRRMNRRKSMKNMFKIGGGHTTRSVTKDRDQAVCNKICINNTNGKHSWLTPFDDKNIHKCHGCHCISTNKSFIETYGTKLLF